MKILLPIILTLTFFTFGFGQGPAAQAPVAPLTSEQAKSFDEIMKMNAQLVKLYGEKKFDEALAVGKNMLALATKNDLTGDARVLPAVRNLAEVYLAKSKESEAIAVLQIAAGGYEKLGAKGEAETEKLLPRLAVLYANKTDYKNAEAEYLKLKSLTEKVYGEKSRQSANAYRQLAELYNLEGKAKEADLYYQKAVLTNDAVLNDKDPRDDVKQYECFLYHQSFKKDSLKDEKNIFNNLVNLRGIHNSDNFQQGVVNGKAISLVVPKYPDDAKRKSGNGGFAIVRVNIDTQGNVTAAKAYCGFLDFVKAVEDAALKSKFSPTFRNGLPVEVSGDIVYHFIAR